MDVLCAANEAHTGHAEAVRVERFFGRFDQLRVIGEPEIIVGAHVEHAFAAGGGDVRVLRRGEDPLGFGSALRFYPPERARNLLFEFGEHGATLGQTRQDEKLTKKLALVCEQLLITWPSPKCIPPGLAVRCSRLAPRFS